MLRELLRRAIPRPIRLWLRHPRQSLRWLADIRAAARGRAARLTMRTDWDLSCHPAAVEAFALERDQPALRAELDGFVDSCHESMVLFDIGAHYGLFTLAALKWSGGTARVVAVDPSVSALAVFDANMRLAGAGTRVERFCAAIGDTDGDTALLTGGAGAWHMMVEPDAPRHDAVRVPVMTLETLAVRTASSPTHLKIDVEGQEDAVIRGGERVLREDKPILFLELHGGLLRRSGRSPLAVLERLRSYGYCRFEIAGHTVEPAAAAQMDVARVICRC